MLPHRLDEVFRYFFSFFRDDAKLHPSRPHKCLHTTKYQQLIYRTRGYLVATLPFHLVGLVAIPQAEGGGQVAAKELLLLDASQDGLVDGLLVRSTVASNLLLLLHGFHVSI